MVVVQYGIVSMEYFLDKMKPYELSIICDSLHLRTKDNWEQARLVAYIMAQVNTQKKLKPADIIKFAWETEKEVDTKPLSIDEVERIKAMALQREKLLKAQGII